MGGDIEETVFNAQEIEQALIDWYRKHYLAPGDDAEIEVVGIMNKVLFTVTHLTEDDVNNGRHQGGRA